MSNDVTEVVFNKPSPDADGEVCIHAPDTAASFQLRAECAKWRNLVYDMCSFMLTCKQRNTAEWMESLVEKVNLSSALLGDPDRFVCKGGAGGRWVDRK